MSLREARSRCLLQGTVPSSGDRTLAVSIGQLAKQSCAENIGAKYWIASRSKGSFDCRNCYSPRWHTRRLRNTRSTGDADGGCSQTRAPRRKLGVSEDSGVLTLGVSLSQVTKSEHHRRFPNLLAHVPAVRSVHTLLIFCAAVHFALLSLVFHRSPTCFASAICAEIPPYCLATYN